MASKASSRARLLWQELDAREQTEVLESLAKTRRARYLREYPELLGVGQGYKRVSGERLPQRCFAFLVRKKTKRVPQLPEFISATVTHGRKRRRVEVPTDVEAIGRGSTAHLGVNAAAGVFVGSAQNPGLNATGSICCLVRVLGRRELFALSCNHVLTLSSLIAGGGVAEDAILALRSPHLPFGHLATYSPLKAGAPNQIDAALATVDPATQWSYNGAKAARVVMGLVEPEGCGVFTPRGLEPATWVKTYYDVALPYPTAGLIRIAAAYQFEAATLPGDSGSAVMDNSRTLYGMHFWGDPVNNFSLAIPAGYLFTPGVFGGLRLQLA